MTHAHSPALPTTPMTPWDYIRLRRVAAGLTRVRLVDMIMLAGAKPYRARTKRALTQEKVIAWLELVETPGTRIVNRTHLDLLALVLPIDADVYVQLATEPADRHPTLCRSCGVADDAVPVSNDRCRVCTTATRARRLAA
jgi:hypothetical protein